MGIRRFFHYNLYPNPFVKPDVGIGFVLLLGFIQFVVGIGRVVQGMISAKLVLCTAIGRTKVNRLTNRFGWSDSSELEGFNEVVHNDSTTQLFEKHNFSFDRR